MKALLKMSQVDITNVRSEFHKVQNIVIEMEKDFDDGFVDSEELRHWKERLNTLLQKMTPEQRSLVLDDFDETPLMYRKVLAVVESQEVTKS